MNANSNLQVSERSEPRVCRLAITGERQRYGIVIIVDEIPICVTLTQFHILLRLLIARSRRRTGFVQDPDFLYPKAICNLRQALEKAGEGKGMEFIETGIGQEYRLGFHPKGVVALDESAIELVEARMIKQDEFDYLQKEFGKR